MNSKQRRKNRQTATNLKQSIRGVELEKHICENCGQPGGHWIVTKNRSIEAFLSAIDDQEGFYTCKTKEKDELCPNCGLPGPHFVEVPDDQACLFIGNNIKQDGGFWTCPKLYGKDGRRLSEHT